jgi:hypothetical protein
MPRRSISSASAALIAPLALLALTGCGKKTAHEPAAHVRLSVTSPADSAVINGDQVTVSGTARPATSSVRVLGEHVTLRDGAFSTTVQLGQGAHVIDVMASAPHTQPAFAALRVTRQDLVKVPVFDGSVSIDQARDQIATLGLVPDIKDEDGFFGALLPLTAQICSTDPAGGQLVQAGTTVHVAVSKVC